MKKIILISIISFFVSITINAQNTKIVEEVKNAKIIKVGLSVHIPILHTTTYFYGRYVLLKGVTDWLLINQKYSEDRGSVSFSLNIILAKNEYFEMKAIVKHRYFCDFETMILRFDYDYGGGANRMLSANPLVARPSIDIKEFNEYFK